MIPSEFTIAFDINLVSIAWAESQQICQECSSCREFPPSGEFLFCNRGRIIVLLPKTPFVWSTKIRSDGESRSRRIFCVETVVEAAFNKSQPIPVVPNRAPAATSLEKE